MRSSRFHQHRYLYWQQSCTKQPYTLEVREQVEIQLKYACYLEKEQEWVEKLKRLEAYQLPDHAQGAWTLLEYVPLKKPYARAYSFLDL